MSGTRNQEETRRERYPTKNKDIVDVGDVTVNARRNGIGGDRGKGVMAGISTVMLPTVESIGIVRREAWGSPRRILSA